LPLRQGDGDRKPSPPERTARRQRIKLQGMHERHNVSG
jgi:hypothetical protein